MPFASVTFIVNPRAAGGRTARLWERQEAQVRGRWPGAEVRVTAAPLQAIELAAAAPRGAGSLVVAVGGDGTVHEVVNGLLRDGVEDAPALGVLPCGTGCDYARMLGVGPQLDQALIQLTAGQVRRVDLGTVERPGDPGSRAWFNNVASLGVTAEVVARTQRSGRRFGTTVTYLTAAVASLLRYRNAPVRLRVEDGPAEEHTIKAIALGKGRWFGGGMGVTPEASLDSGDFQLAVFGDLGRLEAVRRLRQTYRCRPIIHPQIRYQRCRELLVEPVGLRAVGVELDGEAWGELPARFAVVPAALRVVAS